MPSHREYKFYYFDLRCRGELVRLLFAYAGIKYDDVRISFEEWPKLKSAVPMGQLPVLEINGKMFCQSTAISRLIAREYALAGKSNIEMAKADMLVEGISDMWRFMGPVYQCKLRDDNVKFAENWSIFYTERLKDFLSLYETFLDSSQTSWMVGDTVTWADIAVAEYLSVCEDCFNPNVLLDHPKLKAFVYKVFELPRLKEYVKSRPEALF